VIPKQPVEFYVHFLLTYDVSHTMHCFFRWYVFTHKAIFTLAQLLQLSF